MKQKNDNHYLDKQVFSSNLRNLLKVKKKGNPQFTQEGFADLIGVGCSTLKKYLRVEAENMPDIDTFVDMCMALEVDPDELLGLKRFKEKTLQDFTTQELLAEIERRCGE